MGPITTRRRKFSALAVSLAVTSSTIAGLVVLGGGAQAQPTNAIAVTAQETADVLTGMRFLQQVTSAAGTAAEAPVVDGVIDLAAPATTQVDPRVGWFQATYSDKQHQLAQLLSDQLDIPAEEFLKVWAATDDVRMRVIYAALTQLGDPYVWSAAGPDGFDCSGLVMWSWSTVGIELPHFSMAQANSGEAELGYEVKPGDLVHAPGHIMMSLGVRDTVVQSTGGGVQVSHWSAKADAFTDPLRPRTVSWTVADGVRRTPDGHIAHGSEGADEPAAPPANGSTTPAPVTSAPAPPPATVAPPASEPADPGTAAPPVTVAEAEPATPTTVAAG